MHFIIHTHIRYLKILHGGSKMDFGLEMKGEMVVVGMIPQMWCQFCKAVHNEIDTFTYVV